MFREFYIQHIEVISSIVLASAMCWLFIGLVFGLYTWLALIMLAMLILVKISRDMMVRKFEVM